MQELFLAFQRTIEKAKCDDLPGRESALVIASLRSQILFSAAISGEDLIQARLFRCATEISTLGACAT
jgi:hypothetical protein